MKFKQSITATFFSKLNIQVYVNHSTISKLQTGTCTNCPPMKIPCNTQRILHFKTIALLLLPLFISDTKSPGDRISVLPQCLPVIRFKDHNVHPWCDVQVVSESLGDSHRLDAGGSCGVPVPHEF